LRIAFFSTMTGMLWGGSESLWSGAAESLLARGHCVDVNYARRKQSVPQLDRLSGLGAQVHYRRRAKYGRSVQRLLQRLHVNDRAHRRWLRDVEPDLVVISIGYHTDDLAIAQSCAALGVPYALLLQAASPYEFIEPGQIESHRAAYANAARAYFVSAQNRDIVEANLAVDLSHAEIVDNPFNVTAAGPLPWPESGDVWKLACVARLQFKSKGHDLLLQALRQPKWRSRPIEISFWGEDGGNHAHIERLAKIYGIEHQIRLAGFTGNIENVWRDHHAMVLASRYEGNPLALIEAMFCGRTPIITNVGRAAELIDDNESGFIAAAPTVELVDDALERAWQRRDDWKAIGNRAAAAIRQRHSLTPTADFADKILAATSALRPASLAKAA
jgi:glycosyltransferase involved in cell wall biosynthesis